MGWTDISDVNVATKVSYQIMNELKDNFADVKTQREIQHETNGIHTLNATGGIEYSSGLQVKISKRCGLSASGLRQKLAGYSSIHLTDGDYTSIKEAVDAGKTNLQLMGGNVTVGSAEVTLLDNSIIVDLDTHSNYITMNNNLVLGNNCQLDGLYLSWTNVNDGKQVKATSKDDITIKNSYIYTHNIYSAPLYFVDDCNHLSIKYNSFQGNSNNKAIYCYIPAANVTDVNISYNYFAGFPFSSMKGDIVLAKLGSSYNYSDSKIIGNRLSSAGGITVYCFDHGVIANNQYGRAYYIDNSDCNAIANNNISYGTTAWPMISLADCDRNVVSANNVYKSVSTAPSGINLNANCDKNEVISNIVRGWAGAGIVDNGANNDFQLNQDF